jgi:cell wall-associated NlpC family hydrolase
VASNRHTPRLVRLAVVTTIAAFTVSVLPGTGQAAPAQPAASTPGTAADAAGKVAALGHQLEILSEDVNGRALQVSKLKATYTKAKAAADVAEKQYKKLSTEVASIVRSTYISAPFGQFTTLMTSSSPEDFLNQLATLERMSSQRGKAIGDVVRAKQSLDLARNAAKTAYGKALAEYQARVAKQKQLNAQITQYKALFAQLTAKERAELAARNNGGTAGRGITRVPIGSTPPAPNKNAQIAVNAALGKQGSPYVWGAGGPSQFDCSGLTMWAWAQAGVQLPHQSAQQAGYGTPVNADLAVLKPGDLLFFYAPISHVAMYIGNGQMVHAPTSGDVVRVVGVDWGNLTRAVRL